MGARENEKTKVQRWEVEGKARRKKETGRTEEGYAVERWWIEEGRGRVGSGVEGLPGWWYRGTKGDKRWMPVRREGAGARAYGAGKLTPFLAYPRSLFNCILLSNFPRRAIDRDTRKGVRLRLISDGPRRLLSALYPPSLSPPLFLFVSRSVGPLARPRSHSLLSFSLFLASLSLPPSSSTTSSTSPTSTPSAERARA